MRRGGWPRPPLPRDGLSLVGGHDVIGSTTFQLIDEVQRDNALRTVHDVHAERGRELHDAHESVVAACCSAEWTTCAPPAPHRSSTSLYATSVTVRRTSRPCVATSNSVLRNAWKMNHIPSSFRRPMSNCLPIGMHHKLQFVATTTRRKAVIHLIGRIGLSSIISQSAPCSTQLPIILAQYSVGAYRFMGYPGPEASAHFDRMIAQPTRTNANSASHRRVGFQISIFAVLATSRAHEAALSL